MLWANRALQRTPLFFRQLLPKIIIYCPLIIDDPQLGQVKLAQGTPG
ncbi:hypothetical protein [Desulfofundulus sp.]